MTLSEGLNILLGGGLLTLLVGVFTLKASVRRANADAERARADAESVRITNTEHATRILMENIVKPLRNELIATREEMSRLREAVERARDCPYHASCPVFHGLRRLPARRGGERGERGDRGGLDTERQLGAPDGEACDADAGGGGPGDPEARGREPP